MIQIILFVEKLCLTGFLFLLFSSQVLADSGVLINEFAAVTAGTTADPDWVEIYNSGDNQVDLNGWLLRDSTEINKIILTGLICPRSFRKFDFSNKLNNDGDTIRLFDSANNLLDSLLYFSQNIPQHHAGQSTGRSPDGGSTWLVFNQSTPINNDCQAISSPTPTPTFTPTSTPTPSPTKVIYKINDVKDENGATLKSVQIYVDNNYIHHLAAKTITFCDGCKCDPDGQVACGFGSHNISLRKNGYNNWAEIKIFDAGNSNSSEVNPVMQVSASTPTPTPTPTLTPTPTPTFTPTPTPKPNSPTPSPKLSPTPPLTPAPIKSATISGLILGMQSSKKSPTPSPTPKPQVDTSKRRLTPVFLILAGLSLGVSSAYLFLIKKQQARGN